MQENNHSEISRLKAENKQMKEDISTLIDTFMGTIHAAGFNNLEEMQKKLSGNMAMIIPKLIPRFESISASLNKEKIESLLPVLKRMQERADEVKPKILKLNESADDKHSRKRISLRRKK